VEDPTEGEGMTIWQRITREPAAILGLVSAAIGLAVLFGVDLSTDQTAGILTFAGALMVLVRLVTTPSAEVAAQILPGETLAVAGPAAAVANGQPVAVVPADEGGTIDLVVIYYMFAIVFFFVATLNLLGVGTRGLFG
jgi:hypothetical protein